MNKLFPAVILLTSLFGASGALALQESLDNTYADNMPEIKAGSKVLVMPLNANKLLKPEEVETVEKALMERLRAMSLKALAAKLGNDRDKFDYLLLTSLANADNETAIKAKSQYAATVGQNYSLVILPSVVQRIASMKRRSISWDGNTMYIMMVGGLSGMGTTEWEGQRPVLSLRLEVYDSNGLLLMTTRGGISIPDYAHMFSSEFRRKDDVFERKKDKKYLETGVKIASTPMKKKLKLK